jgi:adenylylsulfate kinase-like enzyme
MLHQEFLDGIYITPQLIARNQEYEALAQALHDENTRHLFISGMLGHGKTSLAGHLAMSLEAQGYSVIACNGGFRDPWR